MLFDAPHERTRRRIDAMLRAHGYLWVFANARWSPSSRATHKWLLRRLRARLRGQSYRLLFVEISGRASVDTRWLTAISEEIVACR